MEFRIAVSRLSSYYRRRLKQWIRDNHSRVFFYICGIITGVFFGRMASEELADHFVIGSITAFAIVILVRRWANEKD